MGNREPVLYGVNLRRALTPRRKASRRSLPERRPAANVVGLFGRLRHFGPSCSALALAPQWFQGFERGFAVGLFVRQKTSNDESGTPDPGAARQVNTPFPYKCGTNGGEQL